MKSDDRKGSKKMNKEIKKIVKDVKNLAKKLESMIGTGTATERETADSTVQGKFKSRDSGRSDDFKIYENDAASVIVEDTVYPEIDIADFDLNYYLNSGFTIQVQLTRTKDNVTSTCDVTNLPVPADHCHHTSFDDLYFDYLCNMVTTPVYKGQALTCAASERPSTAYCPLLNPTDEAICANQIEILENALDDALRVAESNAADEWDTYFWLLEQMDESGVSIFNNADFLEWVYDHDADNWWCGFDTNQTWDPATQTTLDADGNVVTDTTQVCYTGQDPSLDLTKNARTQKPQNPKTPKPRESVNLQKFESIIISGK